MPALAVTDEQRQILKTLSLQSNGDRALIVEDVVSGHGYKNLRALCDETTALRLFWEFFGLYCNHLVSAAGAYGGVYLTGGVVDEMMRESKMNITSFEDFFVPLMVPVVVESLRSTPVYYCEDTNMPITGLANFARMQA